MLLYVLGRFIVSDLLRQLDRLGWECSQLGTNLV